jgi:dienelactone hydrolase
VVSTAFRLEMKIQKAGAGYSGTVRNEGGIWEGLDNITWDSTNRWLEFRRVGAFATYYQWYRVCLTYGVLAGRFSHSSVAPKPQLTQYLYHVTGWSLDWIDSGIVPRAWNLTISATYHAVLRIDRDANNVLRGRLKVCDNNGQNATEELEDDLTAIAWDGTNLKFTRATASFTENYTGTANGRSVSGTFTHNGGPATPWSGTRAEILGFGLGSRLQNRASWQAETRCRVVNLTEGMRLANVGIPQVVVQDLGAVPLFVGGAYPPERDDNPNNWPANYTLHKLQFSVSPGSRFDPANPPPPRVFYGYLATPPGPVPQGGFRAVVAVNGHGGSAQAVMTSSRADFWYGDSAARRNLIVLAIDVGHRPGEWIWEGVTVLPIVDQGYGPTDSNWEEDGERSFTIRRAIDWLLQQPNVRKDRIFMMGLSMGGEVTTITAGLDPRIEMAVVVGFSPDMHVMDVKGNCPCYRWHYADIHEYLDVSDWEALTAPRPLLVETGEVDDTFSARTPPFSADKQVTRRARAAYGPDAPKLIHYLHYDHHTFHVGDINPTNPSRPRNILAAAVIDPIAPGDQTWQTDGTTNVRKSTLYDLMNEFLP